MSNLNHNSTPFTCPANVAGSGTVGPAVNKDSYVYLAGLSVSETAEPRPGSRSATGQRDRQRGRLLRHPRERDANPGHLPDIKIPGGVYVKVVGAGSIQGSLWLR